MMARMSPVHWAAAALFAGAAAWTLQQQAGYVAASWICGEAASGPVWLLTGAALVLLVAGAWASWRALRLLFASDQTEDSDRLRPRRFLGLVSVMAALLFLFTILLQAAAAFYLPGCLG
jgi:hypothetical protein